MNERPTAAPARPANLLHAIGAAAVAALALVVADLFVRVVPFRLIARRIEGPLRRQRSDVNAVRRVKWAIDAAHRRLPWNVPCLATAIAANRLLARRDIPSELWLGVKTSEASPIDAHAWLVADGCVVTGGAGRDAFRPLHAIVTAAPAR